MSPWHFLPPVFSPCSAEGSQTTPGIWVARVGPGQRGHDRWLCRTRLPVWEAPGHTMPHCSPATSRSFLRTWRPRPEVPAILGDGRRPGFARRKLFSQEEGQWAQPGKYISPIGSNSRDFPTSSLEKGEASVAAPRAAAFSAPGRWAHHCSHERLPPLGSLCNFGGPNCRPLRIQNPRLTAPGLGVAPQHTEPGNGAHGTPHSALGVECVC